MTIKEKSDLIRNEIKQLKKTGIQYKVFWSIAGMNKTSFYNFTSGKTSLKLAEIKRLEDFLNDVFGIEITRLK